MVQHRGKTDVVEIRDRILDKGIVVDAWARVSQVGIAVTSSTRVVVGDANPVAASAASGMEGGEFRSARERAAIGIVQKAFDAWNDHDVDGYTALLDQGYVGETYRTPAPLRGPDDARRAMATCFDTLPDLHFTIESALAVGDDVVVSWRAAPSQVPGCTVTRLQGRKIAHTWTYWDMPNGLQPRATALR